MLKLRIKKLISRLEVIDSKHPGIVLSTITNLDSDMYMMEYIKKTEQSKINQIIESIVKLTKHTEQEISSRIVNKFSNADELLISTTAYGKIIGLNAMPTLFNLLMDKKLICREDNKYQLTDEGMGYGSYLYTDKGDKFIGWRKSKLDDITNDVITESIKKSNFRLFHMTHISNLNGIMIDGVLSHDRVKSHLDISNKDVNKIRIKNENPHKISLHKYVPFYFNPRNAMLFSCQKSYGEDIVIIEVDRKIIANDYTLFSEGNAARRDSKITTNKLDALNFQWDVINSLTWSDNIGGVNEEVKSLMMSECLILNRIEIGNIIKIHCQNESTKSQVIQKTNYKFNVLVNSELFF